MTPASTTFKLPNVTAKTPFDLEKGIPVPGESLVSGKIVFFNTAKERWPCCIFTGKFLPWGTKFEEGKVVRYFRLRRSYTWQSIDGGVHLVGINEKEKFLAAHPEYEKKLYTRDVFLNRKFQISQLRRFYYLPDKDSFENAKEISPEEAEALKKQGDNLKGQVLKKGEFHRKRSKHRLNQSFYIVPEGKLIKEAEKIPNADALEKYLKDHPNFNGKVIKGGIYSELLSKERALTTRYFIPKGKAIIDAIKIKEGAEPTEEGEIISSKMRKNRLTKYNLDHVYYFIPAGKTAKEGERIGDKHKVEVLKKLRPNLEGKFILARERRNIVRGKKPMTPVASALQATSNDSSTPPAFQATASANAVHSTPVTNPQVASFSAMSPAATLPYPQPMPSASAFYPAPLFFPMPPSMLGAPMLYPTLYPSALMMPAQAIPMVPNLAIPMAPSFLPGYSRPVPPAQVSIRNQAAAPKPKKPKKR